MTTNPHLIALNAYLTVGKRSPTRLAIEATVEPKAAADEILEIGAATIADVQRSALAAARANAAHAVDAAANVERLKLEQAAYARRRDDPHGPFYADRFWIGNLVALVIVITVLLVGAALVVHGFTGTPADALLVLVLATTVATVAGDWAGRARDQRAVTAAAALAAVAVVAAFAVGALHDWPLILYAVDLAVILTGAGAGFLVGRGRWVVPRLRAAEQQHTVDVELAHAQPAVRRTAEEIAADEAEYGALVEQIAARVLRAVEEYLRQIDDQSIKNGLFNNTTVDHERKHARNTVDAWPRRLELATR